MKRNRLTWCFIDKETNNIQMGITGVMVFQKEFNSLEETLEFIEDLDKNLLRLYCKLIYKIEEL